MKNLSLYQLLNESERDMFEGFDESQLDEDYPESFNFDELKNIRSYANKKRYIESQLGKPLGSGTARSVYRVDEIKVLKLAKNQKGLAQNEIEIEWGNDGYYSEILAQVFEYDEEKYYWVEMELARKVSVNDFRELWGIEFKELFKYLTNFYLANNGQKGSYGIDDNIKEILDESDQVQLLLSFMQDSGSPPGDFTRKSSWGKVIREGSDDIVLVDFGLTSDVYDSYYK